MNLERILKKADFHMKKGKNIASSSSVDPLFIISSRNTGMKGLKVTGGSNVFGLSSVDP